MNAAPFPHHPVAARMRWFVALIALVAGMGAGCTVMAAGPVAANGAVVVDEVVEWAAGSYGRRETVRSALARRMRRVLGRATPVTGRMTGRMTMWRAGSARRVDSPSAWRGPPILLI